VYANETIIGDVADETPTILGGCSNAIYSGNQKGRNRVTVVNTYIGVHPDGTNINAGQQRSSGIRATQHGHYFTIGDPNAPNRPVVIGNMYYSAILKQNTGTLKIFNTFVGMTPDGTAHPIQKHCIESWGAGAATSVYVGAGDVYGTCAAGDDYEELGAGDCRLEGGGDPDSKLVDVESNVVEKSTCHTKCDSDADCTAFEYQADTKVCKLWKDTIASATSSGTAECFVKCANPSARTVVGNCGQTGITVAYDFEHGRVRLGNVYVGVHPSGSAAPIGLSGIDMHYPSPNVEIGGPTPSTTTVVGNCGFSADALGDSLKPWGADGILCTGNRLKIGNVYVGVTPAGAAAPNKRDGIHLTASAPDTTVGDLNAGTRVVVGNNGRHGIYSDAPRLVILSASVGVLPNGTLVPNENDGVHITVSGTNAKVGTTLRQEGSSKITNAVIVSGNAGNGIQCFGKELVVANAWIGLDASGGAAPNGGDGIRVAPGADDARIGAAALNECSPSGHMICTTATCCEAAIVDEASDCSNPSSCGGSCADFKNLYATGNVGFVVAQGYKARQFSFNCRKMAKELQLGSAVDTVGKGYIAMMKPPTKTIPLGCAINDDQMVIGSHGMNPGCEHSRNGQWTEACGSFFAAEVAEVCKDPTNCPVQPKTRPVMYCNSNVATLEYMALIPVRISSNRGAGIYTVAPRTKVANTLIGLGLHANQTTGKGNRGAGIVLHETAAFASIGVDVADRPSVYIAGNGGTGIEVAAPHVRIVNTAIGVDLTGAAASNGGVAGISLVASAADCLIGSDTATTLTTVSGNAGDGISAAGVSPKIYNTHVGVVSASAVNTIEVELSGPNDGSAKNLAACTGECDDDNQCAAGLKCFQRDNGQKIPGCKGDGAGIDWDYCYNDELWARGNKGFGILIKDVAANEVNVPDYKSRVGDNGFCGMRIELDCRESSHLSTHSHVPNMPNQQRLAGCDRCRCTMIDAAVDGGSPTTKVDCSDDGGAHPPNFGSEFIASLPTNTSTLLIPRANVAHIDWDVLAVASNTLIVLDLSDNPFLDNTFPSDSSIRFPNLKTLNLKGTNLKHLRNTSIRALCTAADGQDSAALESLDLSATITDSSNDSVITTKPNAPTQLTLEGFTSLAAFAWHDFRTCPYGARLGSAYSERVVRLGLRLGFKNCEEQTC
jgi:hypothetical protein